MKKIISDMNLQAVLIGLVLALMGCNKEELNVEKAMQVVVNGYNGGSGTLVMAIDTTQYGATASNGSYLLKPKSIIGTSIAYAYFGQQQRILTLTEMESKKVLFSRPMPAAGTRALFNFIYLDGKELEINPPAADANTNKLGFYIRYTENDAPFDVFLYRRDNTTGQEYRHYLAKNVKPGSWIYFDYMATTDFGDKSLLSSSSMYFTKAGTTDQWAFENNENLSKCSTFGKSFPLTGEKGIVQAYFFAKSFDLLGCSRLFFHPDRPW